MRKAKIKRPTPQNLAIAFQRFGYNYEAIGELLVPETDLLHNALDTRGNVVCVYGSGVETLPQAA